MEVSFRFAVRSDLGTVRTNNEDSALASPNLLVLADGMGGHAAGEVASTVATRVFAEIADHLSETADGADVATRITLAGRSTRLALQEMSEADPMLESMGTTLLAVVSHAGQVTVGHIGDSRVYALRGSSLYQVTTDHTHVQRLVDTGQLTPEKARTHPYRAMLLRSLDDHPGGPDLDVISLAIEPGDRLLLCSDGLSDYLPPEQIGRLLAIADREEAADALVDAALEHGTRDNVTVVVADVVAEPGNGTLPELAGAVVDGLELSPMAGAALEHSLPRLAPQILARPRTEAEPAAEAEPAGREPVESADAPAAEPDGAAVREEPEPAQPELVAEVPVEETDDAEVAPAATTAAPPEEPEAPTKPDAAEQGAEGRPTATTVPTPASQHREPVLPGVLAAALLVLVAVAIGLIL